MESINREVDTVRDILLSRGKKFGMIMPKPEGGYSKTAHQFYKTYYRLHYSTHWADPKNWKD